MFYIATLPLWASGLLLVGLTTALAMLGPSFVRRRVSLERLTTNNEVAGFKFAVVGVVYAVLIAFAVIVVWEKFSDAEHTVVQEAGAVAGLYRLTDGVGDEGKVAIRDALTAYLHAAIENDWPTMSRGQPSPEGTQSLNALYRTVLSINLREDRAKLVFPELLHQLDEITQARRTRLVLASGAVPGVVWLALFAGAFLTVGFAMFFATESLRSQTLMAGLLAIIIFMGLFVIAAIDYPYSGEVQVRPEALQRVLEDFSAPAHP